MRFGENGNFLASKSSNAKLVAITPPTPASQTNCRRDEEPYGWWLPSIASVFNETSGHHTLSDGHRQNDRVDGELPLTPNHTPVPADLCGAENQRVTRSLTDWGVGFLSFLKYVPLVLDLLGSDEFSKEAVTVGGGYSGSNLVYQTFFSSKNVSKQEITHTDYFQISLLIHYSLPYIWSSKKFPLVSSVLSCEGESLGRATSDYSARTKKEKSQGTQFDAAPSVLLHQSPVEQVAQFLNRVFSMTSLQMPTVVLALVYIRRLFCSIASDSTNEATFAEKLAPIILECSPPQYASTDVQNAGAFLQETLQQTSRGYITEENLLVVAFILANKFLDDARFTNSSWHQVSKIPLSVLNSMELEFLQRIKHDVHVNDVLYVGMLKHLANVAAMLDSVFYGKALPHNRLPFMESSMARQLANISPSGAKCYRRTYGYRRVNSVPFAKLENAYLRRIQPTKQLGTKHGTPNLSINLLSD